MKPKWLTDTPKGCIITIRATPRASRSEFATPEQEWLRARLQAPPVEGKANAALINLATKTLKLPKRDLSLVAGESSRLKRILVHNQKSTAILQLLTAAKVI